MIQNKLWVVFIFGCALMLSGCASVDSLKDSVVEAFSDDVTIETTHDIKDAKQVFLDEVLVQAPDTDTLGQMSYVPEPEINQFWLGGFNQVLPANIFFDNPLVKLNYRRYVQIDKDLDHHHFTPVIAEGKIFSLDEELKLFAYNQRDLKRLYTKSLNIDNRDNMHGGMSYYDGVLYISSGVGEILAVHANTGEILWSKDVLNPHRSLPCIYKDYVFVTTLNNHVYALDRESGDIVWSHKATEGSIIQSGGAFPIVAKDLLVVPYADGMLYALSVEEGGKEVWAVNLVRSNISSSHLYDNNLTPIIQDGLIYIYNNSGVIFCLDLETGNPMWERAVSHVNSMWLSGNILYVRYEDKKLMAMQRDQGSIKWVSDINLEDSSRNISWYGPIMVNNKLLLSSSSGELLFFDPHNGSEDSRHHINMNIVGLPIIVNNKMYVSGTFGRMYEFDD